MAIVFDTTDYKVEYEKALLIDAMSDTSQKIKATLLTFSTLLLAVSVYGLKVKAIPGLSVEIPPEASGLLQGVLALAALYLLVRFTACFTQDYLRWRLLKGKASIEHSGKVLSELHDRVATIEKRFDSLEPLMEEDFRLKISDLFMQLNGRAKEAKGVLWLHRGLSVLQFTRFWVIEVSAPIAIALASLSLSWSAIGKLVLDVLRAL